MSIKMDYDNNMVRDHDGRLELNIKGKTVKEAYYDVDDIGYPYTMVTFTDGTRFRVREEGQCGKISVHVV